MGRIYEDILTDTNPYHEGYVIYLGADGAEATSWPLPAGATPVVGYRAACDCGWRGPVVPAGELDVDDPEGWVDAGDDGAGDRLLDDHWEPHVAPLRRVVGLAELRQAELDAQHALARGVAEARAAGASWSEIARPMRMTKQAAHQRFGG